MTTVYLLLGTNLGDKKKNLLECISFLEDRGIQIKRASRVYETDAWGFENQPSFYNQAVEAVTSFSPAALLVVLKSIEKNMGRISNQRWQERLIDIDILYFDNQIVNSKDLIIPHPQLINRRFALVPLIEVAPDFIHPVLHQSTSVLLEICPDQLSVKPI